MKLIAQQSRQPPIRSDYEPRYGLSAWRLNTDGPPLDPVDAPWRIRRKCSLEGCSLEPPGGKSLDGCDPDTIPVANLEVRYENLGRVAEL